MRKYFDKEEWRPGNVLYPLPVVMVSCADPQGNSNIITIAWAGTICSDPAMVSISIRKNRYSHPIICNSREFVINLTTAKLTRAMDYCGVRSGKDINKWEACHLTPLPASKVKAPLIGESPVNIECKVEQIIELGSHDLFLARVVAVHADRQYMDENGKFDLSQAHPIVYSHGEYYDLGKKCGTFGYSVRKK